jgi:hypothetical protein
LIRDVESGHGVSYGDFKFLEALSSCGNSVRAVFCQCFTQSYLKRFNQLFARGFLAIYSGNFLHPTYPPTGIFLDDAVGLAPMKLVLAS